MYPKAAVFEWGAGMPLNIVFLGWGSLIWDKRADFDDQRESWNIDGPELPLEFSRVSKTRCGALTLVIDPKNGSACQVAYARSRRNNPDDAIADLRCRESTVLENIGFYFSDGSRKKSSAGETHNTIATWAKNRAIDVVIWTDLKSNFSDKSKNRCPFSIEAAIVHIQGLDPSGKVKAAEYIWQAPDFINTPLRRALQAEPWFRLNQNSMMKS